MGIIRALMIICPIALSAILLCYFIDGVLKYEFRNRRLTYALTTLVFLLTGVYLYFSASALKINTIVVSTDDPRILISYLIVFIIIVVQLSGKVWKRILIAFLSFEILSSITTIFLSFAMMVAEGLDILSESARLALTLFFDSIIIFLEFAFLVAIDRVRRKNDSGPLPIPVVLAIWFFLSLFTGLFEISYQDEVVISSSGIDKKIIQVFLMILGLAFMFIFFYVRSTRRERDNLREMNVANEELVETQTRYFEASADADNKIRAIKHDMRNNLQVLSLLLESGEYDKMREYLEQLGGELSSADISSHTGDVIADAIITDKKQKALSCGAVLNVTGVISGVEFAAVDMCKILGNILDNAIEAVSDERLSDVDVSQKVIDLVFKKTDKFFMISLVNPCAECPQIKDGLIDTYKSDKKNHGFGLKNVREAAEAYGGEMSLSCEEKASICMFRTEIMFALAE